MFVVGFMDCRSYADIGIHEQMIADEVRTQAYRLFMFSYLLSALYLQAMFTV